jgi:hypothetical protein
MNLRLVKGYVQVILTGLFLSAVILLIILQWDLHSQFSLFGKLFNIIPDGTNYSGGLNTAILMIASGIGGIVSYFALKFLFSGLWSIHKGHQEQSLHEARQQLNKLNTTSPERPEEENETFSEEKNTQA